MKAVRKNDVSSTGFMLAPGDRLVPHNEAARILGCSAKALYDRCYDGKGPKHVVRSGRTRSYLYSEISALIGSQLEVIKR